MPLRKLFFWAHLIAGVTSGIVILTMAMTGFLLVFERQIIGWAERDLRATATEAEGQRLLLSTIVAAAATSTPDANPSNIMVRADSRAPVAVAFGQERTLFVNPFTGVVLGEGATHLRHFFHVSEDLHRRLALKGAGRAAGKQITGVSNMAFLFIVLSGLYIWIPRRKSRGAFRNLALFRTGVRGRARDINWHNVLGIWSFIPLVAIVFSGVVISYPWATALVYRAFGDEPPRAQGNERGAPQDAAPKGVRDGELDRLWSFAVTNANNIAPEWKSIAVRLPLPATGPVSFALDEGNWARPDKRSQLMLDPLSGRVLEHKTYAKQVAGQKARAWLQFIHTGEAGGILGQLVAALATGAAVVLVWTGLALALRRLRHWLYGLAYPQPNDSELMEGPSS